MFKQKFSNARSKVGLVLLAMLVSSSVGAADLFWDGGISDIVGNGDGVSAGGSGTWDTTIQNWDQGSGVAHIAWPLGGNANKSYFGGAGGSVTFGANIGALAYPNSINVTAGDYVFDQAGYSLSWRGTGLTISSGATLVLTNGTVTLQPGSTTFGVTGVNALKIYSKVTGNAVFNKSGAGQIYLYNDDNDFTGKLYGQNGYNVFFSSIRSNGVASAAGQGDTLETGYNNSMIYIGSGDATDRTFSLIGAGNDYLRNNGTGALTWNGSFSNTKAGASTLTLGGSNTDISEFNGVLTNSPAGALSVTKADGGTWKLSAANMYSGGTAIYGGMLLFSKTNAMPAVGTVAVNNNGTLGINLGGSGEFAIGTGSGTFGGLLSGMGGQSAPVTYSGDVGIRVDTGNATAGQTNSINISNLGSSLALIKAGAGEFVLTRTNTYSGATTVEGGKLRFENYADLATPIGSSSVQINNGSTLEINSTVGGINRTVLNNKTWTFGSTGGGTINFDNGNHLFQGGWTHQFTTSGGAQNTISASNGGFMNMQGAGTVVFNVADGSDAVDLLLSVRYNNGYLTKDGAGTLSIQGGHDGSYGITINAGTLDVGGSAKLAGGNFTADISNNGIFSYSSSADQTLDGVISGTGALLKTGSGTLTLASSNTYSGVTLVSDGVLKLTDEQGLSTGTDVVITNTPAAKIELDFNGTVTVRSLTVDGELMVRNTSYNINNLPSAFSGQTTGFLRTLEGAPPNGTVILIQ